MKCAAFLCLPALLSIGNASAQDETRQAVITGRSGSPKCTIEVEIDGTADVEIRSTVAHLHTLIGTPAVFRRFECNQPLPPNPANFRFSGIDGRGRQTLIGDPRSSGAAVVRLEDPKPGREGYTFDLEWGGSDDRGVAYPQRGYPPPAYPTGPPRRDDRTFDADDATRQCGEAARDQLRRDGYSNLRIVDSRIDGQGNRGDWIYGTLTGQRGRYPETFDFACPVDFQNRRVGQVNVRRGRDGYYGADADRSNHFDRDRALRACRDAVQDRLRDDGYASFNIGKMDLANRSGDNGSIAGSLTARRGPYNDTFQFSCAIDFDAGRVRSVNLNRR